MKLRQTSASTGCQAENGVYSKNPRFKIQKLLKSRIVEFNEKCLLMKSYGSINDSQQSEQKIPRPGTLSLKSSLRPTRYPQLSQSPTKLRSPRHPKPQETQTIDIIKQQISKTLIKDLLFLKSSQQELIPIKNKNAMKIKLRPSRKRNFTINYNQCCELAQARFQRELVLGKEDLMTPKLSMYQYTPNRPKIMPPLIYFLHKKQPNASPEPILNTQRSKKKSKRYQTFRQEPNDSYNDSSNYKSERKKSEYIHQLRESMYSPWDMNNTRYQGISQVLFAGGIRDGG